MFAQRLKMKKIKDIIYKVPVQLQEKCKLSGEWIKKSDLDNMLNEYLTAFEKELDEQHAFPFKHQIEGNIKFIKHIMK